MKIQVKVPGKLILLGEYAVLEGANALVAAVNRYAIVTIESSDNVNTCQITSNLVSKPILFKINANGKVIPEPALSADLLSRMHYSLLAIEKICSEIMNLGYQVTPFNIHVDTTQFYRPEKEKKLGLGSSAALMVAIIIAVNKFLQAGQKIFTTNDDLFKFVLKTHSQAQDNRGSGIDVAASIYGGIIIYNMNKAKKDNIIASNIHQSLLPGLHLLPVWTGISASTRKLLSMMEEYRIRFPAKVEELMKELCLLSNKGCKNFKDNNRRGFLDIVSEYYEVMKDFSSVSGIPIISEVHERIANLVYNAGGIYKPSGAGEGDLGIALCDSRDVLDNVKKELQENNIETLLLQISFDSGYI